MIEYENLEKWQQDILNDSDNKILVANGRITGKDTTIYSYCREIAKFGLDYNIGIIVPNTMKRQEVLCNLQEYMKGYIDKVSNNSITYRETTIYVLINNDKTMRGYTVNECICNECLPTTTVYCMNSRFKNNKFKVFITPDEESLELSLMYYSGIWKTYNISTFEVNFIEKEKLKEIVNENYDRIVGEFIVKIKKPTITIKDYLNKLLDEKVVYVNSYGKIIYTSHTCGKVEHIRFMIDYGVYEQNLAA